MRYKNFYNIFFLKKKLLLNNDSSKNEKYKNKKYKNIK